MTTILEVDYDLSDVMFVWTANTLRMLEPLLDRMDHPAGLAIPKMKRSDCEARRSPKQRKEAWAEGREWAIAG